MRYIAILSILFISGCSSKTSDLKLLQYDRDIVIVTSIVGSGGALGDEDYQVSYRYDGEETRFFEGTNPHGFNITKIKNSVSIRFCDGTVRLAQPIFLGSPRNELIHLKLDLDCPDREIKNQKAQQR